MRARLALRVLVLLLTLSLLPFALARATHNPTVSELVSLATGPWGMQCSPPASQVDCDGGNFDNIFWHATIKPGSGTLTALNTAAAVYGTPLESNSQNWMSQMHSAACAPGRIAAGQVATFAASVGGLTAASNVPSLTIPNECILTGGMFLVMNAFGQIDHYEYWINSTVIVPPAPTPTPPPPTPRPSVAPTATPRPTATPTPTPSPTPTASPTASPTDSGSPSEEPSATPEQTVGGILFSPEPSPPDGAPAPDPRGGEGAGGWAASVQNPADIRTDPAAIGASALWALLLLLFMGFVGELFNNTAKANYDVLVGWWERSALGKALARIGLGWRHDR